jgi:hypothetical protein
MSKGKWYTGLGTILLLTVGFTNVANTSTISDNLLSNNFYDDWSGTNDHFHGPNVLAGVHNEYREQTITLSDHLEAYEIQGLTQSQFQAEVWFWNQYSQSVDLTQEIVDSNGAEYSNTITMSGTCNSWNGCGYQDSPTNTIIINDIADDYDITARFSFSVPSRPNHHYAADVRNPELFVTYEPFAIDIESTLDVEEWLDDFEEEYLDDFSSSEFLFEDEFYDDEPFETLFFTDYYEIADDMYVEYESLPELPEEEMEIIEEDFEMEEEVLEVIEEELPEDIVEEVIEEEVEDVIEETSEPEAEIESDVKIEAEPVITKFASMAVVDEVSINIMIESQPVLLDAAFYEPVILYANQLSLTDNRDIYSGVVYVANDPLSTYLDSVKGNQEQQYILRQQLENMKWID